MQSITTINTVQLKTKYVHVNVKTEVCVNSIMAKTIGKSVYCQFYWIHETMKWSYHLFSHKSGGMVAGRCTGSLPLRKSHLVLQVQVCSVTNGLSCTVRGSSANPLFNSSSHVISLHHILGVTTVSRTLFSSSPSVTAPQWCSATVIIIRTFI